MPSFINTNLASLNAQRNLNSSQMAQQTALQRLSSGLRINSAKDDAAGMAIASRMSSQIAGNIQATRNANDGISLAQTAEGDLTQIATNLQRMRDLAVQSANATNSVSDRAALNAEVQSLAQEIDRVAQNSSFNGVKLLDGSFVAQNFQIGAGATANDQISINAIASARTTQLGGVGATSAASVTSGVITGALTAGALTLNGQQVGATSLGAAPGQSLDSAFQYAVAINAVSANSGVTAVANAATVTGATAPTAFAAIAANTFQINGIQIGAIAAGGTAPGQGANIAAAINLVATQTGVTASANATTGQLTLTAADGRDIAITAPPVNGVTLASAQQTTFLANTGLAAASVGFGNNTALSGAYTAGVSANVTDLYKVSVDGISAFSGAADGVANTAANLDTAFTAFAAAHTAYRVTGTIAGGNLVVTKADGSAVATSTQYTNAAGTGAPAGASLTTAGGGLFGGAAPLITGAAVTTTVAATALLGDTHGTITLSSTSASGIVLSGGNPALGGFTAGTTAATTVSSVSAISAVDISTAAGATAALSAIDGAIATVNSSRASLGAYQNRFASVVASLQTTTENLTASRSRIQDTDFAAETASLSRAQILQQAGTAMLAQANQLPNQVMTLLR